jgi:hypothetical protein
MNEEPELPLARPVPRAARRPPAGTPNTGRIVRLSLLAVGGLLAGVFAVALWLNPYDEGGRPRTMATHTQLGMAPCNFVIMTGTPGPACGMTTSFALLVRGELAAALRANWAGVVIAVIWAVTMVWAVAGAAAGRPLFIPKGRGEVVLTVLVGVVVALMLGRWGIVLIRSQ